MEATARRRGRTRNSILSEREAVDTVGGCKSETWLSLSVKLSAARLCSTVAERLKTLQLQKTQAEGEITFTH